MMNVIFAGIILFSFVFAALTGRMPQLSLTGMLCLWSGLMKIAQESGLTELLSRLLSPVTKRLFKGLRPNGEAVNAITMNLIANFLGLGNAATPLGIRAMCEMAKEQRADGAATNDMAMFVVVNTASIQLIPATTAMLRMQAGSAAPLDILPATWIASVGSVAAGIVMAGLLASLWRKRP